MASEDRPVLFTVQIIPIDDIDDAQLDEMARQLQSEIRELDVESIEPLIGQKLPEGTRSAEAITLGALVIAVLPPLLPPIIQFLQSWVERTRGKTIRIKAQQGDNLLEVEFSPDKNLSSSDVHKLAERITQTLTEKGKSAK